MNSYPVYPRFSDPHGAHMHLMGLSGLEGPEVGGVRGR